MSVIERRECGRCGAEVREGKTRHYCGEPYPLKATTDIRVVRYVPVSQVDIERERVIADDEAMRRARYAYLNSAPHGVKHDDAARLEHMRAAFRAAFEGQSGTSGDE
jgi:hypothetical protein